MNIPLGELLVRDRVVSAAQLAQALDQQRQTGRRLGDTLVGLGFIAGSDLDTFFQSVPPVPRDAADTGLPIAFLTDLMLKTAYFRGQSFTLPDMAKQLCLPVAVVDELAEAAKVDRLLAIRSGGGFSRMSFVFGLTELGLERTENALRLSQYAGPAPVPLQAYRIMTAHQTVRQVEVDADWIEHALAQLVIGSRVLQQLGPAFNSGRSIFLYGPAGTGKSAIAEALGRGLAGSIYVPHAVQVDGQVIRLFDPSVHTAVESEPANAKGLELERTLKYDPRWVLCRRPVVLVGGELGLDELDLEYDPISKFYEAPAHMKAANGVFILDDFGRQRVPPRELLNRWIVPLERGTDFLELHTGKKLEIPFDQITIFCTNLKPGELVDEAFLRRIRHKIQIPYQTEPEFIEILQRVCRSQGIAYKADAAAYLVDTYYRKANRPFVGSHPRDLVDQIIDRSRFNKQPPQFSAEAIDAAAANYFVSLA